MINIIVNPKANGKKAAKIAKKVDKYLTGKGVEHAFFYTDAPRHAIKLAEELSKTSDTIVALGGDGTINEVLNGLDTEKVKFGIIPSGSGNDFIAAAGIPQNPIEAVDLILSGEAKPTDYMVCGGVRGLNIIGTGIDVDILKRCKKSKILRGKLQYVISLVISLIKFRFYKFYICKGELDFVIAGKLKKRKIPHAFVKLMQGKILEQDFTSFERCEHVRLEFDKPVTIQVDGELYDGLDFDLSIVKSGIKIYRP